MLIPFEPPYDPKKAKLKAKLERAWRSYYILIWKGGDIKMNKKIKQMVAKGSFPPNNESAQMERNGKSSF